MLPPPNKKRNIKELLDVGFISDVYDGVHGSHGVVRVWPRPADSNLGVI